VTHLRADLEPLAAALHLEFVDELSAYRERLDRAMASGLGEKLGVLSPLKEGLAHLAEGSRDSAFGWSLTGRSDGVAVNVRPVNHSVSGSGVAEMHVEALFDPSLGLGLHVSARSWLSRAVRKVLGHRGLETGNRELDEAIRLRARDGAAAVSLFSDAGLAPLLLSAFSRWPAPVIDDRRVEITHDSFETRVEVVRASLLSAAGIVRRMSARR
jgi:hypothetical protein